MGLSNGSVHRAWNMVAQTIRHAMALGLHLEVFPGVFTARDLRRRARVWWSLYRMEVLLSEITGRPKCVNDNDITTPTGLITEKEEDTEMSRYNLQAWDDVLDGLNRTVENSAGGIIPWSKLARVGTDTCEIHFAATLQLSILSTKVASNLYLSPSDSTWADVQKTVRDLVSDLRQWQESLHPDLRIETIGESNLDPRANLDVALGLCSLQMILYRPFLCEIRIEDESAESIRFNNASARAG